MKKTYPHKKIIPVLILVFTLGTAMPVQSQISFDDDVDDEAPAAPIDGLLGLGLLAGVYYGIQKLRK